MPVISFLSGKFLRQPKKSKTEKALLKALVAILRRRCETVRKAYDMTTRIRGFVIEIT